MMRGSQTIGSSKDVCVERLWVQVWTQTCLIPCFPRIESSHKNMQRQYDSHDFLFEACFKKVTLKNCCISSFYCFCCRCSVGDHQIDFRTSSLAESFYVGCPSSPTQPCIFKTQGDPDRQQGRRLHVCSSLHTMGIEPTASCMSQPSLKLLNIHGIKGLDVYPSTF